MGGGVECMKTSISFTQVIALLAFLAVVILLPGQTIRYENINGLTWQATNAPANDVFNFQYNSVQKKNQLTIYRNGFKQSIMEYLILEHHHKTILRIIQPRKRIDYVVSHTIWHRGILMGFHLTDLRSKSIVELVRQTSTLPPLFYGIE